MKAIGMGVLLFAWGCIVCHLVGCTPPQQPAFPTYCYDETAFRKELVGCVTVSTDKESSRECRRFVHAACGFVMTSSSRVELP